MADVAVAVGAGLVLAAVVYRVAKGPRRASRRARSDPAHIYKHIGYRNTMGGLHHWNPSPYAPLYTPRTSDTQRGRKVNMNERSTPVARHPFLGKQI